MENKMSSKMKIMMIVIGLTTLSYYSDVPFVAIGNAVLTDYPEATPGQANFILTGAAIIYALVCLVAGAFCKKIGSKKVLMIGITMTAATGCCLGLVHNIYYIMALRFLMGVGTSFASVAPLIIINSVFSGDKSRSTAVGFYDACASGFGFILTIVAGLICVTSWKNIAIIYAIQIPVWILALIVIPGDRKLEEHKAKNESSDAAAADDAGSDATGVRTLTWGRFAYLMIPFIMMSLLALGIYYYISVIIAENGLTSTSAAGAVASAYLIGATIGTSTLGLYYEKLRNRIPLIAILLATLAAFIIFRSTGIAAACIGMAILGCSYNVDFCYHLIYYPMIAPEKNETIVSILTFIMGGGPFIAGYLMTLIMTHTSMTTAVSTIPVLIVLNAIGLVFAILQRKKA